jgi:hypothetical protein
MEFKKGFSAGQDNTYNETTFGDSSQNISGGVHNLTIINSGKGTDRIVKSLSRIRNEIGKEVSEQTKQAVKFYETKLKGTKNVEQKLSDGGFKPSAIKEAVRLKQFWAMEAFRTSNQPVIQEENFMLYTRIVHKFGVYIMPLIEDGVPLRDVMRELDERIIEPIMTIYRENGYSDENLRYTYDHIKGMIYYLTGNCHLNWKDYDNDDNL